MAYIPWPDSAEIVVHWTIAGIPVSITIAATKPGGFTVADQNNVNANVDAWLNAAVIPLQTNQISYVGLTNTDKRTSTGPVVPFIPAAPVPGGVASVGSDIISAMVMSPRSINRGRSGRGRKFVPGIPSANRSDNANWTAGAVTAMATAFGSLDSNMNLSGFSWTVPSEVTGGVPRTNALMQEVVSLVNKTFIATKSKRGLWR